MAQYLTRLIDSELDILMSTNSAVMLVGPRASGKTTTASRRSKTIIRLDRPAEAGAFEADPDSALRNLEEPILLDEWQQVPSILGAIKRAVDSDPRPGRFIITGSVSGDFTGQTWPITGRVIRLVLHCLTVREQLGMVSGPCFIDRIVNNADFNVPSDSPDLYGYLEFALRGGFPLVWNQSVDQRTRWLESYVDQLTTRDAISLARIRDPSRLRRYINAYALNSAGIVTDTTLLQASGLDRSTANTYERLLADLFVIEPIPPWTSNKLQRLTHLPKRYFLDSSLLASVLQADIATVMRDSDLIGRVLDTFVVAQLRSELKVTRSKPILYHLREHQGRHEADLLAELRGSDIVAFEIKATSAPKISDARHLIWLKDKLQDRFIKGIVLHTGPSIYSLGQNIVAMPISTLWS